MGGQASSLMSLAQQWEDVQALPSGHLLSDIVVHLEGTTPCKPHLALKEHQLTGPLGMKSASSWLKWWGWQNGFEEEQLAYLHEVQCFCFKQKSGQYVRCHRTIKSEKSKGAGAHIQRHGKAWIFPTCSKCNMGKGHGNAFRIPKHLFGHVAVQIVHCSHATTFKHLDVPHYAHDCDEASEP